MSHIDVPSLMQFMNQRRDESRQELSEGVANIMDTFFAEMNKGIMEYIAANRNVTTVPPSSGQADRQQLSPTEVKKEIDDENNQQQIVLTNENVPTESTLNVQKNAAADDDDKIVVKNELGEIVDAIPNVESQPSNGNNQLHIKDEDCDCNECVGDLCLKKEEVEDEIVELIDDAGTSRPNKRARLEDDVEDMDLTEDEDDDDCVQIIE